MTERQSDKVTKRQGGIERDTYIHTYRQTDRQTDRQTEMKENCKFRRERDRKKWVCR